MYRPILLSLLSLLSLALSLTALADGVTVILNGQTVTIPVVEQDGRAYIDAVALMQLLGGKATYDGDAHKLWINPSARGGGGGGAAAGGTAQLAGDNGVLGQVYILRKRDPLYFSLKSADFTVAQVKIGDTLYAPKAAEKLLVLHYTIQNPNKTNELNVRFDTLRLTAFDPDNNGHDMVGTWGDEKSGSKLDVNLKPSQTVAAYTVIAYPAKGAVPKLMVQSNYDDDGPVLRYDLTGKVTPLQAPVADPADPTGATALSTVPTQMNVPCPLSAFTATVTKFDYITDTIEDTAPPEGGRYLLVSLQMKNEDPGESTLRFDTLVAQLIDADGQTIDPKGLFAGSSLRSFNVAAKPGQSYDVRLCFAVPKDVTPKKLTIRENESRVYQFDVP